MSTGRRFVGDVAVRTGFQILNAIKGLIYLPLIARLFGTTGYSIWSQVFLTITLFAPLMTLRLDSGLARYMGGLDGREARSQTFFSAIAPLWVLSLAALIIGLIARQGIAFLLFADSGLIGYSLLFGVLLVTRVNFTFVSSYYRSISKIRFYTGIQTVQILLEVAALYGLTLSTGRGLEDVLWAFVIIEAALVLVMLMDIIRRDGPPHRLSRPALTRLLKFSLPLVPAAAMYWVVNSSDRYVIVHLIGLDQAGIYSAAYRVAQVLKLMVQPISFVLLPLVASFWERGEEIRAKLYMSRSALGFLLLAIPAAAGLIGIGPQILTTLGTSDFVVSRLLIALLAVGEVLIGLYQVYVYIIYLHEKTWIQPLLFSVLAALNLAGNLLLVPRIGILGAAVTTFGAYSVQTVFTVAYTNRLLKLDMKWPVLIKALFGGACVYIGTRYLPGEGLVHVIAATLVGVAIYVAVMAVTHAFRASDVRELIGSWNRAGKQGG